MSHEDELQIELDDARIQIAARDKAINRILDIIKPEDRKWKHAELTTPEYYAWCLAVPLYSAANEIASNLDEIAEEIEAEGFTMNICPRCLLSTAGETP